MATGMELALLPPDFPGQGQKAAPSSEDFLERLEQTEEGARLRQILAEAPAWVQRVICDVLRQEEQHSFARIAEQAEAAKRVVSELQEMCGSDDAIAVAELARQMHGSKISALKWEAERMKEELCQLKHALAQGDLGDVQKRAQRLGNQAERFRDGWEYLHPKLQRLQHKMLEIAERCSAKAQESNELIAEAERRREWWSWMLSKMFSGLIVVGSLVEIVGSAGAVMVASSLGLPAGMVCGTIAAVSAICMGAEVVLFDGGVGWQLPASAAALAAASRAITGSLVPYTVVQTMFSLVNTAFAWTAATIFPAYFIGFALASLGQVGRALMQRLLIRMWDKEIKNHTSAREWFNKIAQKAEEVASNLKAVSESSEALYQCADMVVETAYKLAATAEDAQARPDDAEMARMREYLDTLCQNYEKLPEAIDELQRATANLARQCGLDAEAVVAQASLDSADAGDDWILVESPSRRKGGDCLPRSTYILVPVEMAARLGALFAAGPGGNRICQLRSQGISERLMSVVSVGGALHRMTASHPFRVLRSGSWIHETASLLSEGDILATPGGGTAVVDAMPSVCMNTEEVFELQTQEQGEEIYIFTGTPGRDGAPMSLSGVAVLGSVGSRTRCASAPPRLYHLPSLGSRLCKGETRCSNVCRDFIRNRCLQGEDCSFCHRYHPEEPKRPPRGRREDARSSRST